MPCSNNAHLTLADRDAFEEWIKSSYRITSLGKAYGHGYIGAASSRYTPVEYSSIQMLWDAYQAGARSKINSDVPSSST